MNYSVFTKPWKTETPDELGAKLSAMGFNAIEFALRDGYQVTPDKASTELKPFADKMAEYGLKISSVASSTDEHIFAACQEAGVPLIRIMCNADLAKGYLQCEYEHKKKLESLLPLCEKYGVKVGVQHHFGAGVSNTMEMRHLLEEFDPKYIGAIWDAAHSGLAGEEPEQALNIIWDKLVLVNLKTACYIPTTGAGCEYTTYKRFFTTGKHGICNWERAVKYLKTHNYSGDICLPAEYTQEEKVEVYTKQDLDYVKELFAKDYE